LSAADLCFGYSLRGLFAGRHNRVDVLHDVSFELCEGEILGVVGESGAGKTTLFRACTMPELITGGTLTFRGLDLRQAGTSERHDYRRQVQLVFQDPFSSFDPVLRMLRCVLEPAFAVGRATGRRMQGIIADTLADIGLPETVLERFPSQLSGGQLQRISVARATGTNPAILLADECVSALDVTVQAAVLTLLKRCCSESGLGLIFAGHDLAVVRDVADEILVLRRGRAVEYSRADMFFRQPVDPYSRELVHAATMSELRGGL
jgi:peptide/nickel transport system ATP-binding protein